MSGLSAGNRGSEHLFGKRPRLRFAAILQWISRIEPHDAMILHPHERRMAVHDGNAKKVIETALQRPRLQIGVPVRFGLVAESEVPLAKTCRGVALALQHARQRWFRHIDNERTRIHHRPPDVFAERILAREQCIPRRRANRRRRMRVREPPPLVREPVDIRRLHLQRAIAAEIAIAEVICEDEHDVRLRREERGAKGDEQ
jgi:hypothetical protein